jgi:DNA-binding SARP family transcriptional activator/tetratricopeptide (TPR) repeat protein
MQVRLLGPVDVIVDGGPRPVRGVRRGAVLAVLALHCGKVVSTGQLVDIVWGETAPPTVVNTLQAHVSYLRRVLGSKAAIRARPPGYVLDLGTDGTDVQLAEQLLRRGTRSADPVQGARLLETALALWRGRPLVDLVGLPWLEAQAERLELLGVRVKLALSEARLAAGEHLALAPDLEQLAAERPLDEQVHAQLMLALYRSGRQADALAAYHQLRVTLDEELGIDPGQELRDLEAAVLRQDPALDAPRTAAASPLPSSRVPIPAQLPSALPAFVGRGAELASLNTLLPVADEASSAAVAIAALSGTAGVGKTTLAVHWAHRVSARFPDGQLYVNLKGFDPGGEALDPGEAVRGFLEAFGVPVTRIPADLPGRAGLYRSLLAGKRVLVVLDNARDVGQVRPLLPGSSGCLALVTSRNHLTGLVATEGAHPVALDLLPAADARDLLIRRLGSGRVAREPAAADDIIARCARLPLALTIAAARAATSPGFPLAVFATELREATRTLDPFDGGDLATDVRTVFSWSYGALGAVAARLFRLLGLHPGPDLGLAAAASLAAIQPDQVRAPLTELTRAHLLAEPSPGRYALHDLLRSYAAEQAQAHDSQQTRAAAVHRLLDHYLHTARNAVLLIEPHFEPPALTAAQLGASPGEPGTAADAMSWFRAEHAVLLAAVQLAADAGHDTHAWQLAWMLSPAFIRRGSWTDHARAQHAALAAARRTGDAAGEAHARHGLAMGYARSGRFHDAYPHFQQALRQFEAVGDRIGQARIHDSLAWLSEREQRPADSLGHALRALELSRAAGHLPGQAAALNSIGFCQALLGDYQQAIASCEQALDAIRELGERNWEAATWDSLGYIHHQLGEHERAVTCYQRAIDLYCELADRFNEADTLDHLGDVQLSAGNAEGAERAWADALLIFDEIDHPDGDRVRVKLQAAADSAPRVLQAFAAGLADGHVDRCAQPGQRARGRSLRLHLADELTGDVHDQGDPAERETRRLQRGGRLGLAEADHARHGGRVVPADGEAPLVAERHLAHVAQVADLDRERLNTRRPAVAQVEQAVVAPGEQRAVRADRRARPPALADLDDAAQVQLRRGELLDVLRSVTDLAAEVVAPGVHGVAGAGDRQGVGVAGRDLGHPGQRHRDRHEVHRVRAVTHDATTPGEQGPVGAQCVAEIAGRAHLDDPGQAGHRPRGGPAGGGPGTELSVVIPAPGQDGAVRAQRERVIVARGQLGDPGQAGYRHGALPVGGGSVAQLPVLVITPGPDDPAGSGGQHVERGQGDLGDPGQAGHGRRGMPLRCRPVAEHAVDVDAPGVHGAVGQQHGTGFRVVSGGKLLHRDLQSVHGWQAQHGSRRGPVVRRPVAVFPVLVPSPAEDGGRARPHALPGRGCRVRRCRRPGDGRGRHHGEGEDHVHAPACLSA